MRREHSPEEREAILDATLRKYASKGWNVDDRSVTWAVISKECGPLYALVAISRVVAAGQGVYVSAKDREGRRDDRLFKRRDVQVDEFGAVKARKAPMRRSVTSRYAS